MDFISAWIFYFISLLVIYLTISYGLFFISKSLWIKNNWISWIPLWQFYIILKCSWKSLRWILYAVFIFIIVSFQHKLFGFLNWELFSFIFSFSIRIFYISFIIIIHDISLKIWRWLWTTVWFLVVPFLMCPYIWYKINKSANKNTFQDTKDNNQEL